MIKENFAITEVGAACAWTPIDFKKSIIGFNRVTKIVDIENKIDPIIVITFGNITGTKALNIKKIPFSKHYSKTAIFKMIEEEPNYDKKIEEIGRTDYHDSEELDKIHDDFIIETIRKLKKQR